ncbi:MAG: acyltransferase [Acidobacteriia bacterium]|nr:acyltransferase [Terriglobia bacterium]
MMLESPKSRVPELDGLRGVAILLVVVCHYVPMDGTAPAGTAAHLLQRFTSLGWSGVDLFFVLSGFLIGGILLDARTSASYYSTFYARRFFRIIPIYYLWITAYIALAVFAGATIQRISNSGMAPSLGLPVYLHYLFLQNLPGGNLPGLAGAWFVPLWSLAVEEQFYLIAPLVVRFVSPRQLPRTLGAVIAFAPALRAFLNLAVGISPLIVGALWMPSRADALALGMLLAVIWRREHVRMWFQENIGLLYAAGGFLSLGVLSLWIWAYTPRSLGVQIPGYTCLAFFYACLLLIALLHSSGPLAALMRMAWLRELGKVSYCVYIIHEAVNVACHAVLLHKAPQISTAQGAAVTCCAAGLTYIAAKISYLLIEQPLLRRGHAFKY